MQQGGEIKAGKEGHEEVEGSFLMQLAKEIAGEHQGNMQNVLVLLPNRRAMVFFRRLLAEMILKPSFFPRVLSIEDFVSQASGRTIPDELSLQFRLYNAWTIVDPEEEHSFEEFLRWGSIMLSDFNEVDLYLANPLDLFRNLSEARALELWSPGKVQLTAFQKNYLEFFRSMYAHYTRLREVLDAKNEGYFGMLCRMLAEQPSLMDSLVSGRIIYLAGFNALSIAEEQIFNYLIKFNHARPRWDADHYYLDDKNHEAGLFLRRYRDKWGKEGFKFMSDNFHPDRNIQVCGLSGNVPQVKAGGNLLKGFFNEDVSMENTAVVLADEKLLFPTLNSIPGDIGSFNVTMGYPIKITPLFQLVNMFFQTHITAQRLQRRDASGALCFYYADIQKLATLPPFRMLFGDQEVSGLQEKMLKYNKVFLSCSQIEAYLGIDVAHDEALSRLFFCEYHNDLTSIVASIRKVIRKLYDILSEEKEKRIDLAICAATIQIFERLEGILREAPFIEKLETLRKVFNNLIATQKLPFEGEPVDGLQIMGLLESRCLDFKNLILLSANEGSLPRISHHNSFIPFDLRIGFGLPGITENDAVYAYHFYRLIQRAEYCYIFYNTDSEVLSKGEKSRYITQMEYELGMPPQNIRVEMVPFPEMKAFPGISKPKDEATMNKLYKLAMDGLSPTSLNAYRNCPLKFWYQYVAGVKEAQSLEETIEARTLGSVVHKVIEVFFRDYTGRIVHPNDISMMLPRIDEELMKTFHELYPSGELKVGQNHLIVEVARRFLLNFLKEEAMFIETLEKENNYLSILKLEEKLMSGMLIPCNGQLLEVKLRGYADRIDSYGNYLRIIDYKTGIVNQSYLKMKQWDELLDQENASKKDIAFQLQMYKWLYESQNGKEQREIVPMVISMRKPSETFPVISPVEVQDPFMGFEPVLNRLLSDIFDIKLPFGQTNNEDTCKLCPFKGGCMRLNQYP